MWCCGTRGIFWVSFRPFLVVSFSCISFCLVTFPFVELHFISFSFILFHLVEFHFVQVHFTSSRPDSFHFVSSRFISLHLEFNFTSSHTVSFNFGGFRLTKILLSTGLNPQISSVADVLSEFNFCSILRHHPGLNSKDENEEPKESKVLRSLFQLSKIPDDEHWQKLAANWTTLKARAFTRSLAFVALCRRSSRQHRTHVIPQTRSLKDGGRNSEKFDRVDQSIPCNRSCSKLQSAADASSRVFSTSQQSLREKKKKATRVESSQFSTSALIRRCIATRITSPGELPELVAMLFGRETSRKLTLWDSGA